MQVLSTKLNKNLSCKIRAHIKNAAAILALDICFASEVVLPSYNII